MTTFIEGLERIQSGPKVVPVSPDAFPLLRFTDEQIRQIIENRERILPQVVDELRPGLDKFNQEYLNDSAEIGMVMDEELSIRMTWGVHRVNLPGDLVNPNASSDRTTELHEVGKQFEILIHFLTGAVSLELGRYPRATRVDISTNLLEDPEWQATLATTLVQTLKQEEVDRASHVYGLRPGFLYDINITSPQKNQPVIARLQ